MTKILAFSGSSRKASLNQCLVDAASALCRDGGAEVTSVNLGDLDLPLYNGDFEDEHGVPEAAEDLRSTMVQHDGFLISCPEYNGSITPLLKNTIDWVSRAGAGEVSPFRGKTAALVSASPGALGGLRGLVHVRAILGGVGVLVVPTQCAVGSAMDAFDDTGSLAKEPQAKLLGATVHQLLHVTSSLRDAT